MDKFTDVFTSLVEKNFSHKKILASVLLIFININIEKNDFKSFSEWIFNQNIKIISNFYESFIDIEIASIVYPFIFIYLFSKLYLKINKSIINGQIKNDGFIKKIDRMKEDVDKIINLEKILIIRRLYKEDSEDAKSKLKNMADNGSTLFSLGICSLLYSNYLGVIDFILILLMILKSIHYLFLSTSFFIEENTRIIFVESISKSIPLEKMFKDSSEEI